MKREEGGGRGTGTRKKEEGFLSYTDEQYMQVGHVAKGLCDASVDTPRAPDWLWPYQSPLEVSRSSERCIVAPIYVLESTLFTRSGRSKEAIPDPCLLSVIE